MLSISKPPFRVLNSLTSHTIRIRTFLLFFSFRSLIHITSTMPLHITAIDTVRYTRLKELCQAHLIQVAAQLVIASNVSCDHLSFPSSSLPLSVPLRFFLTHPYPAHCCVLLSFLIVHLSLGRYLCCLCQAVAILR